MKFSKAALTLVLLLAISLCICGCSKDLKDAQTGTVVNYNHGAFVKVDGDNINSKYYDNISDAWVAANKILDKNVTVKLYQDWVAADGSFGNGDGFADGTIQPVKRNNNTLILDLNKHKIDRNLSSKASKAIFNITTNVNFTIKNGEITGGYNEDNGGAIMFDNDYAVLNLVNLKIHDNYCAGSGGGIFFSACNGSASLKDCKIYNNKSDERGGGIYFEVSTSSTPPSLDHFSTILTLINSIQVNNNHGKNDIDDNFFISGKNFFVRINAKNINSKSKVMVGIDSKDDSNPVAEIQKDSQAKVFASDDNNYYTSPYTSQSGKYICLYTK